MICKGQLSDELPANPIITITFEMANEFFLGTVSIKAGTQGWFTQLCQQPSRGSQVKVSDSVSKAGKCFFPCVVSSLVSLAQWQGFLLDKVS